MNLIPNIIGSMLGGLNDGNVGSAQANSAVTGGSTNSSGGNNGTNFALGLMSMLKGRSNPMQVLRTMANTNPRIKEGFDYVEQNGGDLQSAFYKLANDKGIDPESILKMIR